MKNTMRNIKKDHLIIVLGIIWSFILLLFCSKCSFLYSFNYWVDLNAFFTVGKAMIKGLVPYKDIFEQKGPLLYLIFGLAYLIDNTGFSGVFIFEIISMTISFMFFYKIANLYIDEKRSVFVSMLMVVLFCTTTHFLQGGSAEEFCLPLFLIIMYTYLNKESRFKNKVIFINGILAAFLGLIKVNFLTYPFAWMSLLFFEFIFNKEYSKAFKSCIWYLFGMAIPIGLFLVYFIINNALYDFINVYLLINSSAYKTIETLKGVIAYIAINTFKDMLYPVLLLIFNLIGVYALLKNKIEDNLYKKIFIIYSSVLLASGIYMGGHNYRYYYLPLVMYLIFGLIYIFKYFNNVPNKVYVLLTLIFTIICICLSDNVKEICIEKEYYAQYKFKEIIETSNDQTILNFNELDLGMYLLLDQVPTIKYFEGQNISYYNYPYILDGQLSYIEKGVTKWIVSTDNNCELLDKYSNYKLVAKETYMHEDIERTLVLYQRID